MLTSGGEVRPLEEMENEIIRFAISHYRGQMSEVARRLKIGRSTLYRKLDEAAASDSTGGRAEDASYARLMATANCGAATSRSRTFEPLLAGDRQKEKARGMRAQSVAKGGL